MYRPPKCFPLDWPTPAALNEAWNAAEKLVTGLRNRCPKHWIGVKHLQETYFFLNAMHWDQESQLESLLKTQVTSIAFITASYYTTVGAALTMTTLWVSTGISLPKEAAIERSDSAETLHTGRADGRLDLGRLAAANLPVKLNCVPPLTVSALGAA